jgi:hypothetical protein
MCVGDTNEYKLNFRLRLVVKAVTDVANRYILIYVSP